MASKEIQRVIKVGNSIAVVLPAHIARAFNIQVGDTVALSCVEEGVVVVRKLDDEDLRAKRLGIIHH